VLQRRFVVALPLFLDLSLCANYLLVETKVASNCRDRARTVSKGQGGDPKRLNRSLAGRGGAGKIIFYEKSSKTIGFYVMVTNGPIALSSGSKSYPKPL
jgi:hypothetical protein